MAVGVSSTRLAGRKLILARTAFVVLFLALLVLFIYGIPAKRDFFSAGHVGLQYGLNRSGEVILIPSPGLPADQAGIRAGDVLLAINGVPIPRGISLREITIRGLGPPGDPVTLEVRATDGSIRRYTVTRIARDPTAVGMTAASYVRYLVLLDYILVLGFCLPALLIFWRKPDDGLGMFVALVLVLVGIGMTYMYTVLGRFHPQWRWADSVFTVLHNASILTLLYVFPSGQFVPGWTRRWVPIGVLWGILKLLPAPYNPWAWPYYLGNVLDFLLFGTGLYAQIYRYRRVSTRVEKQQTKWVVFGWAAGFIGVYAYQLPQFFLPALQEPSEFTLRYQVIGQTLSYLALLVIPLAITLSILRYRLYDIDIIINRTLVYVPLTAILAGLYSASISFSQKAFIAITGQESDAAIVLTTLVLATAFTPIKNHLQGIVDKRFKEAPDPNKLLKAFQEQVERRLFPVEFRAITRQVLEQAILAFDAKGGAIYRVIHGKTERLHATRGWTGAGQVDIPLVGSDPKVTFGYLSLGPRRNTLDYTARDIQALQRAAQVVAVAIEQDVPGVNVDRVKLRHPA